MVRSSSALRSTVRRCPDASCGSRRENDLGDRIVDQLGEAMARLHSIDPAAAPATIPRPEGAGPIETGLATIDTQLELLTEPSPVFAYAARWLERNMPSEPGDLAVVHSDIRNGNIIVGDDGLRAILDWEGTRVGDPMEDLAWPCQRMWRFREEARTVGGLRRGRRPPCRLRAIRRRVGPAAIRLVAGARHREVGPRPGESGAGSSRRQFPLDRDGRQRPPGGGARVRHAAVIAPDLRFVTRSCVTSPTWGVDLKR